MAGAGLRGLVLMLVATTTVMAVQDRIREHAVLRTVGLNERRVFGLVMVESFLVSLAGGAMGVAAAIATLAFGRFSMGTEGVVIAFEPSLSSRPGASRLQRLAGLLAGIFPAWQATRSEIVAALRHVYAPLVKIFLGTPRFFCTGVLVEPPSVFSNADFFAAPGML